MSFLDEQPDETLAAAFALIDSCDDAYWGDDDRTTESNSGSPSSSGGGGGGFSSSDVRSTDDDADSSDDTTASSSTVFSASSCSSSMGTSAASNSSRTSLRVVIRTTNNKKLAVDATTATATAHHPYKRSNNNSSNNNTTAPMAADEHSSPGSYRNKNSVLRFRARKKAEAALLREEAAALETQLAQLRNQSRRDVLATVSDGATERSCDTLVVATSTSANAAGKQQLWMELAALQARERFAAEALNQQLHDAVQKQRAMGSALEAMLRATAAAKQTNFVRIVYAVYRSEELRRWRVRHTDWMLSFVVGSGPAHRGAETERLQRPIRDYRAPSRAGAARQHRRDAPALPDRLPRRVECERSVAHDRYGPRPSGRWGECWRLVRRDPGEHTHAVRLP